MSVRRVVGRGRSGRERGAVLFETLLIAPVFFVLVLGIIEYGLVFRDYLAAGDAVGDGARRGAVVGNAITEDGGTADFEIVRSVREGFGSMPTEWITDLVVFRGGPPGAGSALAQVPAACKAGTAVTGVCNVYDVQTAFLAVQADDRDYFNCDRTPTSPSCPWNPTLRRDGPTSSQIDYLGVWIRVERPYVTGLFGDELTFERASLLRLEPGALE